MWNGSDGSRAMRTNQSQQILTSHHNQETQKIEQVIESCRFLKQYCFSISLSQYKGSWGKVHHCFNCMDMFVTECSLFSRTGRLPREPGRTSVFSQQQEAQMTWSFKTVKLDCMKYSSESLTPQRQCEF